MIMEAATLTGPPRQLTVSPIQKSLSLPSYARASGEGIDHTIIFAALEQREKIRRKSKIFRDKEKCGTTRQNYFCLPLSSNGKCRETSLSSDTSCSSLEFQKPKCRASPVKLLNGEKNENIPQSNTVENKNTSPTKGIIKKEESFPEAHQPIMRMDNSRSTIGSSDSMERTERSSKSSNDSLTRKERLMAIKARVEAEREKKLCGSSSDEEADSRLSRYNSDGLIHRTVRDVKSKSTKHDKRYRRRTHDEMAIRRALRKQHTSLYLPHTSDFDVLKPPIIRSGSSLSLQRDSEDFTKEFLRTNYKTYFESVSHVNSSTNHYFSDICSGNLKSRVVKSRVEDIEFKQLESKLNKIKFRNNKTETEHKANSSENIESNKYRSKFKNVPHNSSNNHYNESNIRHFDTDFIISKSSPPISRVSTPPIPRAPTPSIPRAPTPPPRSPKSIEFVTKAFIQHQNVTNYLQGARSLERKKNFFRSNMEATANDSINKSQQFKLSESPTNSVESLFSDRKNKGMANSRRRTLCNFPHVDEIMAFQRPQTPTNNSRNKFPYQNFPPRSPDLSHKLCDSNRKTKGYASGSDISTSKATTQTDLQAKKWERLELDSEKKFNSLESRSKVNMSILLKDKFPSNQKCVCFSPNNCQCETEQNYNFKTDEKYSRMFQIGALDNFTSKDTNCEKENKVTKSMPTSKTPPIPVDRLCKSEINLTKRSPPKTPSPKLKTKLQYSQRNVLKETEIPFSFNSQNDSENLDTAMKELENIYLSLRISTENLTVTDEKTNAGRQIHTKENPKLSFFKNRYESLSSKNFMNNMHSKNEVKRKIEETNFSFPEQNLFPANNENVRNTLCIEELFTDLTQQLDLEQRLLQETKHKKTSNVSSTQKSDDSSFNNSSTNERLQTNNHKPMSNVMSNTEKQLPITRSDIREILLSRKKKDAVESITTKLSHVMETNAQCTNILQENQTSRNHAFTDTQGQQELNDLNAAKKNIVCTSLCQKSEDSDEIWQVRVSMSKNQANPCLASRNTNCSPSNYSRLRSALRLPQTGNSRDPSPIPGSPHSHERSLYDNNSDFDKILNTLIDEVPDTKKNNSSQIEIQEKPEEYDQSKSFTKGEMLVLQHLDLIRNFDPS